MPGKAVRLPPDLLARYDRFAERENEARRRVGLLPISGLDLLRFVASRFAGLPTAYDVDLAALRAREKLPADMWSPPHPPIGKARAKKSTADQGEQTADFSWTPPHGGIAAENPPRREKGGPADPPRGGRTAKKGYTANITTPPNPPIGKARSTAKKGSTS